MVERWVCPLCCHVNEVRGAFSAAGFCQGERCSRRRGEANRVACVFDLPPPAHRPEIACAEYRGAEA